MPGACVTCKSSAWICARVGSTGSMGSLFLISAENLCHCSYGTAFDCISLTCWQEDFHFPPLTFNINMCIFEVVAWLDGMKWYLAIFYYGPIYHYYLEHLFVCVHLYVLFLRKCLFEAILTIFNFIFLNTGLWSVCKILGSCSLVGHCALQMFLHSVGCLFAFCLWFPFCITENFALIRSQLFIICLIYNNYIGMAYRRLLP